VASLAKNNIASIRETRPVSKGTDVIIEKKTANKTVSATFILTGMLFQPKTGSIKKNADILVSTITKPSNFSIISSIFFY
jgi:hypothetical protein